MLVILLVLTVSVIYYLCCFRPSRKQLYKFADSLPDVGQLPIIGHAHWFIGSAATQSKNLAILAQRVEDNGGIGAFWLGPKLYVAVINPEDAQKVLEKSLDKDDSYEYIKAWLGNGLFVASYEQWRYQRKALVPIFHKANVESYIKIFNEQSSVLVERLALMVDQPKFDIYKFITACTLDIVFETAMGEKMDVQHDPDTPYLLARKKIMSIINKRIFKPWLQPDAIFKLTSYYKKLKEGIDISHEFSNQVILKKRQLGKDGKLRKEGRRDILDLLIAREENFNDQQLREQVDSITIAGNDTTALVIAYTIWVLGSYQDIQQKVYDEIRKVVGDSEKEPTKEEFSQLIYMEMVIKEVMRLYTVIPVLGRKTSFDLKLSNCTVPPGVGIIIAPYWLHRSKKLWGLNVEEFNPDRFSPENSVERHPCAFVPFSHGARNCIGRHFGWLMMKSMLVHVLKEYKIKSRLSKQFKLELLLYPIAGHKITVERRRKS